MPVSFHFDPIEHAARHYDALGASAEAQSVLHEQMMGAFIDAVRDGRDERMPGLQGLDGLTVTEWLLTEATADDNARLMRVLHLALCKDNAQAIHEAALAAVEPVARRFADAYVLWEGQQ